MTYATAGRHKAVYDEPYLGATMLALEQVASDIGLDGKARMNVVAAGDLAFHLYVGRLWHGGRTSLKTAQVGLGTPLLIPQIPRVAYVGTDLRERVLRLDCDYLSRLALLHPHAMQDARPVRGIKKGIVNLKVLTPVDLAVTLVETFDPSGNSPIVTLAALGLFGPGQLKQRIHEALHFSVGATGDIEARAARVLDLVKDISASRKDLADLPGAAPRDYTRNDVNSESPAP